MTAAAQPYQKAFDAIGTQAFEEQRTPGFAFAVLWRGQLVFAKGYGIADVAGKTPVTPATRFAIGSITKQFTAAAVLMLAEQGKLTLDDRLAEYVPTMPNANTITLRMLLNQDSGLHNYPNTREHNWPIAGRISPEKIIAILQTDKPDFAPGEKWAYSNTNYALLAYVVTRASGMAYEDFLAHNIFSKVGMHDSGSGFAAQEGTATPYEGKAGDFHEAKPRISLDLFYGAGSMVSTAEDLARWDAALMGNTLLKPESLLALWTNGTLPDGQPVKYAMGFIATSIGQHREVWHNGYSPRAGGYCFNAIFPDDELAVVVLANAPDAAFRGVPEKMVGRVLALYDSASTFNPTSLSH